MFRNNLITLVMPCHNEETGLEKILTAKPDFIDEVIVIDNASEDQTSDVAKKYGAKVIYELKKGYGAAYRTGLPHATGDIIITMDGDCTYPLEDIERLLITFIEKEYDFLSGCRFPLKRQESMFFINQKANAFSAWLIKKILGVDFQDLQTGMWVIRRDILRKILPNNTGMAFSQAIKVRAWLHPDVTCGEAHINYHPRVGTSKFRKVRDSIDCVVQTIDMIRTYRLRRAAR